MLDTIQKPIERTCHNKRQWHNRGGFKSGTNWSTHLQRTSAFRPIHAPISNAKGPDASPDPFPPLPPPLSRGLLVPRGNVAPGRFASNMNVGLVDAFAVSSVFILDAAGLFAGEPAVPSLSSHG